MTVNSATGAQTSNVNYSPVDASTETTTDEQNLNRLQIVPYTQTSQSDTNLIANFNRARVEQRFQQENQVSPNNDIGGITTETAFPLTVSSGETQESVMRRAFEAMADRAGLSPESKQAFVESRMKANTNAEGKALILHIDKKPPTAYTGEEWARVSAINFYPNDADIKELKQLKSDDNFNAGAQSADEIIRALELGHRGIFDKLMSDTDASTELAKALNKVRQNGANYDFQQGLLNRLGADRAVQLEEMLKDNFRYNSIIREAVSTTGIQNPERQDRTADIRREIAEKSSLEALVRLTNDPTYPMDKNFLVGAGKRVMTRDIGWKTRAYGEQGVAVKYNFYNEGTKGIMYKISRNAEASLELLQDAEFVKNATILENSDYNDDTISQIIRSGTSREMQEKNADKVNNAVRVIAEIVSQPGNIRGTSKSGLRESENTVTERMANAMVDMFINNPSAFVEAAGREGTDGMFDGEEFRKFVAAVRPHKSAMERLTAAVAIEYNILLRQAENGNSSNVTSAGNLTGAFVDALISENARDGRQADEERAMLGKAIGIAAEVFSFYGLKNSEAVGEITADVIGKVMNEVGQGSVKGNSAERATEENDTIYKRQQTTNAIAVVTTFELAANERVNGAQTAQTEEKRQAQEFLQALRVYNESLPAGERILDSNGRLVNWRTATPQQRVRIADIFGKKTRSDSDPLATPLDKAVNLLNNRMKPTFSELRDATSTQIRRQ